MRNSAHPHYAIPLSDLRTDALSPAGPPAEDPELGDGFPFDPSLDDRDPVRAAVRGWHALQPRPQPTPRWMNPPLRIRRGEPVA